MTKKLLALILGALMIFASVPSIAADVVSSESTSDLNFLNAFSLVPEGVSPDKAMTRAELAGIYYKLVTDSTEINPADYPSEYFTDVGADIATPVNYAYGMKLMNGIGGGLFDPSGNVTYVQLIKTMVSFLGYDIVAQTRGGWPNGYYAVASELGLMKYGPADTNATVTWAIAQTVFMNAVNADVAEYFDEEFKVYKDTSYLSVYRDIIFGTGIVTADNYSDMDDDKSPYYGYVKINSVEFAVLEGAKDIIKSAGHEVNFMYREGTRKYEILYFQEGNNKETIIDGDDIGNITDSVISYWIDNKEYKVKYNNTTSIIYNGTPLTTYSTEDLNPFDTMDGYITCINNDGDSLADAIYITAYEVMVAGPVRDGVIYSKFATGQSVDLDGLDEGTLLNADGNPVDWKDIEEGVILSFLKDLNGKVTKVYATIDVGGGIIEEIVNDENGNIDSVYVAGREYQFAKSTRLNEDISKVRLGSNLVFYFGIEKTVADFEIVEGTGSKFGLVTGYDDGQGLDSTVSLRVYTSARKFEVYKVAEKLKFSGNVVTGKFTNPETNAEEDIIELVYENIKDTDVLTKLGTVAETGEVKRQLIKYTLNDAGEISSIMLPGADGFYRIPGFDGKTAHSWKRSMYTFAFRAFAGSSSSIFVMPEEANRSNDALYAIKGSDLFGESGSYALEAYNTKKNSPSIQYGLYISNAGGETNLETTYNHVVIKEIRQVVDADEMEAIKVVGYGRGGGVDSNQEVEFIAASEDVLKVGPGDTLAAPGDILKVAFDVENKIINASLILDYSEGSFAEGINNPSTASYPSGVRYSFGKVLYLNSGYITVELPNGVIESYPTSRFAKTFTFNDRTGKMEMSDFKEADVYPAETFGDEASYAFFYTSGEWFISCCLFN